MYRKGLEYTICAYFKIANRLTSPKHRIFSESQLPQDHRMQKNKVNSTVCLHDIVKCEISA